MGRGQFFDASQNYETTPTTDDVEAIKLLMQDRFLQRSCEAPTFDINAELEDLCQQSEETLSAYYKRARSMMERVVARDRPKTGVPLSSLEITFFDGNIWSSVKGISDFDVKKEAAGGLSSPARSIHSVHCTLWPKKQDEQRLKSPS